MNLKKLAQEYFFVNKADHEDESCLGMLPFCSVLGHKFFRNFIFFVHFLEMDKQQQQQQQQQQQEKEHEF